jgi:ubiquinone/menaquinone biosynthesis C-methylase UbiE
MTTTSSTSSPEPFWGIRSQNYDRLFWVRDGGYLSAILDMLELRPEHLVLDVGTGTGVVARAMKDWVRHVVALDPSGEMLQQGSWEGVSVLRWDISDAIFASEIFDRVVVRMALHHMGNSLGVAMRRCREVLKPGGRLVVAEALPPSEDVEVVRWWTEMFRLKEDRLVFSQGFLWMLLTEHGFRRVHLRENWIQDFSVANWLQNSGLPKDRQEEILNVHRNAPASVKRAHQIREVEGDCLIRSRNLILSGEK